MPRTTLELPRVIRPIGRPHWPETTPNLTMNWLLLSIFLTLGCGDSASLSIYTDPPMDTPKDVGFMSSADMGPNDERVDSYLPTDDSTYEAQPAALPRLTRAQYLNTIESIFGENLPRILLETDTNPDLFYSIGAASTDITERSVELYSQAAQQIAAFALGDERASLTLGCAPNSLADPCVEAFIRRIGRRLFRRPLDEDEVTQWMALASETATPSPTDGLTYMLSGMLQSPYFLYRILVGQPDPTDEQIRNLTGFELAQRLSFTLLNTGPSETLLDAAQSGELDTVQGIHDAAMRLLEQPESRVAITSFFEQYLDLGRLKSTSRSVDRHPQFSPELITSMGIEMELLINDIIFENPRDIRGLFSERRGYVNGLLAELYELDIPDLTPNTFVPVEFEPGIPRAGILTLGAFLTMNAHPTDTSPTLRGKYLRERLFCQEVPAPPDNVDLNLDNDENEETTLRARLEAHREDPQCAGCHSFIDPPGFLFENYDGLGKFRTEADGYELDATGSLDGVPMENALDLAEALRENETLISCMIRQLYRHTQARVEKPGERPMLRALEAQFALGGYDFQSLILALVQTPGFRTIANVEISP